MNTMTKSQKRRKAGFDQQVKIWTELVRHSAADMKRAKRKYEMAHKAYFDACHLHDRNRGILSAAVHFKNNWPIHAGTTCELSPSPFVSR